MSLAKVIEVMAEGISMEEAVENAVIEASKTVHNIKGVYVEHINAIVEDNTITKYRLNLKITFIVGGDKS